MEKVKKDKSKMTSKAKGMIKEKGTNAKKELKKTEISKEKEKPKEKVTKELSKTDEQKKSDPKITGPSKDPIQARYLNEKEITEVERFGSQFIDLIMNKDSKFELTAMYN